MEGSASDFLSRGNVKVIVEWRVPHWNILVRRQRETESSETITDNKNEWPMPLKGIFFLALEIFLFADLFNLNKKYPCAFPNTGKSAGLSQ